MKGVHISYKNVEIRIDSLCSSALAEVPKEAWGVVRAEAGVPSQREVGEPARILGSEVEEAVRILGWEASVGPASRQGAAQMEGPASEDRVAHSWEDPASVAGASDDQGGQVDQEGLDSSEACVPDSSDQEEEVGPLDAACSVDQEDPWTAPQEAHPGHPS